MNNLIKGVAGLAVIAAGHGIVGTGGKALVDKISNGDVADVTSETPGSVPYSGLDHLIRADASIAYATLGKDHKRFGTFMSKEESTLPGLGSSVERFLYGNEKGPRFLVTATDGKVTNVNVLRGNADTAGIAQIASDVYEGIDARPMEYSFTPQ